MDRKITLIDENGNQSEVELVTMFLSADGNKKYVLYSKGEVLENGNKKIYASSFTEQDNNFILTGIADENEWNEVKNILFQIVNGGE